MTNDIVLANEKIADLMRKPDVVERFAALVGKEANQYIQSVLITVATDLKLSDCTPNSILRSALQAASLGLSCDRSVKQAWIVPYNAKIKGENGAPDRWEKQAQFQPHYLGLYNLAMRTNKYKVINVSPVPQGWTVEYDILTGLHSVKMPSGLGAHVAYLPTKKDAAEAQGWIGYFETYKGFKKTVYWSVEDIEAHAAKYSKSYKEGFSPWKKPETRPTMQMKTVLLDLLKWADLTGTENSNLRQAMEAAEAEYVEGDIKEEETPVEALAEGGNVGPPQQQQTPQPMTPGQTQRSLRVEAAMKDKRPWAAEYTRQRITEWSLDLDGTASATERNLVAAKLNEVLGDETRRHEVCKWLVGTGSVKEMRDSDVLALKHWLGVTGFGSVVAAEVTAEAEACHAAALKGQLETAIPGAQTA